MRVEEGLKISHILRRRKYCYLWFYDRRTERSTDRCSDRPTDELTHEKKNWNQSSKPEALLWYYSSNTVNIVGLIFNRVLRDSSPQFVRQLVRRSIGRAVKSSSFFIYFWQRPRRYRWHMLSHIWAIFSFSSILILLLLLLHSPPLKSQS